MSDEHSEGQWVLWECRNGVEIAARRTANVDEERGMWECGTWLWYAGGRHTVAGVDNPFDLVKPICRLVPDGAAEQNERLQQELQETHQECGAVQRRLEEEREKTASYSRLLQREQLGRDTERATLMSVIKLIARR